MAKKREVWHPAEYDRADVRAIQALAQYARLAEVAWDVETMGSPPMPPSEFEVKRALDWIIHQAAQTYDDPFMPGATDVGQYVMGRQSVGRQIVKLMKLSPKVFESGQESGN